LENQIAVTEQHLDGFRDLGMAQSEHRVENPSCFDQDDVGDPSSLCNERLPKPLVSKMRVPLATLPQ
jgi:hypothetical protein